MKTTSKKNEDDLKQNLTINFVLPDIKLVKNVGIFFGHYSPYTCRPVIQIH